MQTVSVSELDKHGNFRCNKCRRVISPDNEEGYTTLPEESSSLLIRVNCDCGNQIQIVVPDEVEALVGR